MLQRLYVNNYRCLENFELSLKGLPSSLLVGENGVGKSTIAKVLDILQCIGRGINRVGKLIEPKDFAHGRSEVPIRIEIEVVLGGRIFQYVLAFELPDGFRELRILEENLLMAGSPVYTRQQAQVTLLTESRQAQFLVDWHLVALPVIQEQSKTDPLFIFKTWLAQQLIILAPIPSTMTGHSSGETLEPQKNGANFSEWFSGLLSRFPAAYAECDRYHRTVMPDIQDFLNEPIGKDARNMVVRFQANDTTLSVDFENLSDGEKCFFLCAVVLAANQYCGPFFCFWDEPDNYLSLSEVGHFVTSLRRSFKQSGQLVTTSHNEEAIRQFSNENTFILCRKSHLEPTLIRLLRDTPLKDDIVGKLIRGSAKL